MDREPTLRNFIASFRGHWLEVMSGGFSVPFAAAAVFSSQTYQQVIFGALALMGAWFAAYRLWASERTARNEAEERVAQLENEYVRALHLSAIDFGDQRHVKDAQHPDKILKREIQFVLNLVNTARHPVEYLVTRIAIDGKDLTEAFSLATVSPNNSKALFYAPLIPGSVPPSALETYSLEIEYTYGEVGRPSRVARKHIGLTRNNTSGGVAWVYAKDDDTVVP